MIPTDDALSGMILQGPAPAALPLSSPTLLTSLRDAEDLGITPEYDADNGLTAHKAVREFYAEAGQGSRLWIMVISQAVDMATALDLNESNYAMQLLDAADGIRMLTVVRDPADAYAPTITDGLDEDVTAAITAAQLLAEAYTEDYKPLRVILPGYGYDGNAGGLTDLKQREDNRVAIFIGDTTPGAHAAVGMLMGRLASVPVMRNPGRVKSGSLPIDEAYIGTETVEIAAGDVGVIHDKGFITLRKHIGRAGYYITDDPTATLANDDYSSLARGRVIDKAIVLAHAVYLTELLDELRVDPNTGRIEAAQAKYLQQRIESAIDQSMTANNEIVAVAAEVDPLQNVLATNKFKVRLRIIPFSYAREIDVDLGFTNPANQ